jgi:hypothetical protein
MIDPSGGERNGVVKPNEGLVNAEDAAQQPPLDPALQTGPAAVAAVDNGHDGDTAKTKGRKAAGIADVRGPAKQLWQQGITPIPIPYGQKGPTRPGWQNISYEGAGDIDKEFPAYRPWNLGALTGPKHLCVDLDCPEAVALAPHYLPPTMRSGRDNIPASHYHYRPVGDVGPKVALDDPTMPKDRKRRVVEVLSLG